MEHTRPPLLIRADANSHIGTGHVMRCLALAQAWQGAGGKVIFITACESEALRQRLIGDKLEVVALSDPRDWQVVARTLAAHPNAWVALDGYHFDTAYQQRFKDTGHQLLVIDDLAQLDLYVADLVLNQNLGAQGLTYAHQPATRLLRGTDYVLLRKEFLSHLESRREAPERARKILVTLGGADPDNITLTIVRALQRLDADSLEVVVAVGASYPCFDDLQAATGAPRSSLIALRSSLLTPRSPLHPPPQRVQHARTHGLGRRRPFGRRHDSLGVGVYGCANPHGGVGAEPAAQCGRTKRARGCRKPGLARSGGRG